MDEKPGSLCERGVLSKLFDRDAAIAQDPFLTIDEGDLAGTGSGVAVTRVQRDQACTVRSSEMSRASSPSVPSMTGNSIVLPSNVNVALRVISLVSQAIRSAACQKESTELFYTRRSGR